MINQQINLYQDRFKNIQPVMSALHGVIIGCVLLVLLVISSWWYQDKLADSQHKYDTSVEQKQQLSAELEALRKDLQARLADTEIENQLRQVSSDIEVRQRMIDFVSNNRFGAGQGFADYLRDIAELNFEQVWLNEISLREDQVRLSGSALKAEYVPQYFRQIQSREFFEGRVFDVFSVDRTLSADWKVDFVIASRTDSND